MIQMTLPYLLQRSAAKFPGKEAIVSEEGRWTFDEWNRNSNRRARALSDLGVGKGDHAATLFLNGRDLLETYLAVLKLGAVLVPLNARHTTEELSYVIRHSRSSIVILGSEFKEILDSLKDGLPEVITWIICGGENEAAPDLNRLMEDKNDPNITLSATEDDTACILYTAGTTGRPKGVLLTHRNCVWAAINLARDSVFEDHYRVLLVFPLYHSAAFSLLNTCLYLGCTLVSMSRFDPAAVMKLAAEEKISKMAFPPTVWNFILQLPDLEKYDTSSLESVSSGAEAMPLETKRRLKTLFPNASLGETYGMTETAAAISTLKPRYAMEKTGSVGRPFTNVEVLVVDENQCELPAGTVGEIVVSGPNVTAGYFDNVDETAKTIINGWLHTGDLGRFDNEDFLYIVDRKKEMIISGGENIYPREVEEVLYSHPAILEAAVLGRPDPVWGERVHAVVCCKPGFQMSDQEIFDYCGKRLSGYKKPRSVEFIDRLPRSPAGKVLKRLLKEG